MSYGRRLTVGSLFAGIGGFDLGLERAGMRVIWQSEIDHYACAVLRKHWPWVPNHGDIRTIAPFRVINPDVLCGGFPCQDISNAGKRAGIDGERSGLWSEFARLIGELRPRYAIMENVSALLGRGMERVLGDLAALGYDAEWHCIPASAVGAPHRRDRVWIVAYAGSEQYESDCATNERAPAEKLSPDADEPRLAFGALLARDIRQEGIAQAREIIALDDSAQATAWDCGRGNQGTAWEFEPDVGRVAHGIPRRVDRLRCLGNAIVPQIAEIIGRAIINANGN